MHEILEKIPDKRGMFFFFFFESQQTIKQIKIEVEVLHCKWLPKKCKAKCHSNYGFFCGRELFLFAWQSLSNQLTPTKLNK